MTQRLLLPSISLMSPLAAEVWANCKRSLYFKNPFALRQKTEVSVYRRQRLVWVSMKTKDTPSITRCRISKGKGWRMRVQHSPLYMCGARVHWFIYCIQTGSGSCPAPLHKAWQAFAQVCVPGESGKRAPSRRTCCCFPVQPLRPREGWAQPLLCPAELALKESWSLPAQGTGWICYTSEGKHRFVIWWVPVLFCSWDRSADSPLPGTNGMWQVFGHSVCVPERSVVFPTVLGGGDYAHHKPCLVCIPRPSQQYIRASRSKITPTGELPHPQHLPELLQSWLLTLQIPTGSSTSINFYL